MTMYARYDIYIGRDNFSVVEQAANGEYVKAEDAPEGVQRLNMILWNAGEFIAYLEEEDDDGGEWVRFDEIPNAFSTFP